MFGSMTGANTDVIQGTLDMLILKTLSLRPLHGFGIARRVEQISGGVFKVNPGSLLTALQRLERAGWLDSGWRETENSRKAKFYSLTAAGRYPRRLPLGKDRYVGWSARPALRCGDRKLFGRGWRCSQSSKLWRDDRASHRSHSLSVPVCSKLREVRRLPR